MLARGVPAFVFDPVLLFGDNAASQGSATRLEITSTEEALNVERLIG